MVFFYANVTVTVRMGLIQIIVSAYPTASTFLSILPRVQSLHLHRIGVKAPQHWNVPQQQLREEPKLQSTWATNKISEYMHLRAQHPTKYLVGATTCHVELESAPR